jgi:hypothetical protein
MTILRCVVTIVFSTIQLQTWWALAQVVQEGLKSRRSEPGRVYTDSTAAIVLVVLALFVVAPFDHAAPYFVFRRPALPVCTHSVADCLFLKATTASDLSSDQIVAANDFGLAAFADAVPEVDVAVGSVFPLLLVRVTDDTQAIEFAFKQVGRGLHTTSRGNDQNTVTIPTLHSYEQVNPVVLPNPTR